MNNINYILRLIILCLTMVSLNPALSHAQETTRQAEQKKIRQAKEKEKKIEWEIHKSTTRIFDTKFPQEYKYKIFPFQFNNDTVAYAAEIISSLDGGNSKSKDKSILVKAVQTFGEELSYNEVKKLLEKEAERYASAAKALNGTVLTNEDIKHEGFLGKNIYISYRNEGKKYGLRIKLFMTNYSKVEQVLSGPGHTMYSYRSDDFFDTIRLYDGITKKENPIAIGWEEHLSKNNVFSFTIPPKNSDYTPNPPNFNTSPKKEVVEFEILDPVRKSIAIYKISSYKNTKKLSYNNVKSILFKNHISQYVKNAGVDSLKTENTMIDDVNFMKTKLIVSPLKKYPKVTTIFLEARYHGDTVVVQEFLCSTPHASSGLNKTLFSLLKFHPENYIKPQNKEIKKEASDTGKEGKLN